MILMNILRLLLGLGFILWGANSLINGASSIAKKFNVSNLVIGLTIVAFGTSMPEFTVSFISSLDGNTDFAIGNIVGSNIFNTLVIVGVVALFVPIRVDKGLITKEIPLGLLSAIVLFLCGSDLLFGNGKNILSRSDGLILLCFFLIFMRYAFASAHHLSAEEQEEQPVEVYKMGKSILFIVLGLAALIGGGKLFVEGASQLALAMGASESIVGLTIVAAGTSLPELATSVVAAFKKNVGIAIGNAIGSNIFNVFFVLGVSATISPLPLGGITHIDLYMLIFSGLLLWVTARFFGNRTITRYEGAFMVLCYLAYVAYLIIQS